MLRRHFTEHVRMLLTVFEHIMLHEAEVSGLNSQKQVGDAAMRGECAYRGAVSNRREAAGKRPPARTVAELCRRDKPKKRNREEN